MASTCSCLCRSLPASVVVCLAIIDSACQPTSNRVERILFSSDRSGDGHLHIWAVDPSRTDDSLRQITRGESDDLRVQASPDGTAIVFDRRRHASDRGSTIWIKHLPTGSETQITTVNPQEIVADQDPIWSGRGDQIGFVRSRLLADGKTTTQEIWVVPVDRSGEVVRPGRPRVLRRAPTSAARVAWNPKNIGEMMLQREVSGTNPFTIWAIRIDSLREWEIIPHECCGNYFPSYSPDGRRLAYLSFLHGDPGGDPYVANTDGTHRTRVTCDSGWMSPAWSPDGRQIVMWSPEHPGLWRINVPALDGPCSHDPIQVTSGSWRDEEPTWASIVLPR